MATVDPQASEVQLKTGLEFRRLVASEIKQNARLVEAAGLKPE